MNQMICYIYEYKGTNKVSNSGFLKIQMKSSALLVQLHIKGLALTNSEALALHIFYKDGDTVLTKHLLDLPVKNKSINMQLSILNDFFPEHQHLLECDGFLFRGPYAEIYVATWKNVPFDATLVKPYQPPIIPESTPATPEPVPATSIPASAPADSTVKETLKEEDSNISTQEKWEDSLCHKISRSELSILPRRFWSLANNSFLLHGFYNFHHLLLIDMEDSFLLGVPGFYDKKEAHAADLFGFPVFSKDYNSKLSLSEDECSNADNFGYWCRSITKTGAQHSYERSIK